MLMHLIYMNSPVLKKMAQSKTSVSTTLIFLWLLNKGWYARQGQFSFIRLPCIILPLPCSYPEALA